MLYYLLLNNPYLLSFNFGLTPVEDETLTYVNNKEPSSSALADEKWVTPTLKKISKQSLASTLRDATQNWWVQNQNLGLTTKNGTWRVMAVGLHRAAGEFSLIVTDFEQDRDVTTFWKGSKGLYLAFHHYVTVATSLTPLPPHDIYYYRDMFLNCHLPTTPHSTPTTAKWSTLYARQLTISSIMYTTTTSSRLRHTCVDSFHPSQ